MKKALRAFFLLERFRLPVDLLTCRSVYLLRCPSVSESIWKLPLLSQSHVST
jgi:hypothetical protein